MKLDPDVIIANINTVISGAHRMTRTLPDLLSGTAEHHTRLHELSPRDAERLRRADEQMATALRELGEVSSAAAARIREVLASESEN